MLGALQRCADSPSTSHSSFPSSLTAARGEKRPVVVATRLPTGKVFMSTAT